MPCLALITASAILPTLAALWVLRSGAPRRPALAGMVAGLLGSGIGFGAFALYCPNDYALFIAIWYGLAGLCVTLAASALGRSALAW